MIRRTFLKTLIVSTGASLIDSSMMVEDAEAVAEPAVHAKPKKVVIGGAGITGLCRGYELMKAGMDVTIFEAAGRYSGHVFTGSDGYPTELYADFGADHITKPGYERLFAYAEEFNIPVVPYPNAEGSWLPYNDDDLRMIGGKFYTKKCWPILRPSADLVSILARLSFCRRTHGMSCRVCTCKATWIKSKTHTSLLASASMTWIKYRLLRL